jgi:hypothetical protein
VVGGTFTKRAEAFVLGTPLSELSTALGQSKKSEIVLAPSATRLFGRQQTENWEQTLLSSGHLLLRPKEGDDLLRDMSAGQTEAGGISEKALVKTKSAGATIPSVVGRRNCRQSLDMLLMPRYENNVMCPPEAVVNRMQEMKKAESSAVLSNPTYAAFDASRDSAMATGETGVMRGSRGNESSYKRLEEMVQRHTVSSPPVSKQDDMGLDALLRFMPAFVRSKCLTGHNTNTLMEHRVVTILFIIADMKVKGGSAPCRPSTCQLPLTDAYGIVRESPT